MVGERYEAPGAGIPPGDNKKGRKGLFIVFEGVDGAGKTTQAEALKRRLQRSGRDVVLVHEPGGTPLGEWIGELLKRSKEVPIDPLAETLLFAASRAQVVAEVLKPALNRGQVVICDRFTASTEAYQGYGRSVDQEVVSLATTIASGGLTPDLWVLLDTDVRAALRRKSDALGLDRFESEEMAFHIRVREAYLRIASKDPEGWFVIDGGASVHQVEEQVWEKVQTLLTTSNK